MSKEFPIRHDITVLPADDPKQIKLGWMFFEGDVILKSKNGFYLDFLFDEIDVNDTKVRMPKGRLENLDDIKKGDMVYSTWYDEGIVAMKIEDIDSEKQTAMGKLNDCCYGNLYFNNDARGCWICGGYMWINKDAIAKFSLGTN